MPAKEAKVKIIAIDTAWELVIDGDFKNHCAKGRVDAGKGEFDVTLKASSEYARDAIKVGETYNVKLWEYQGAWSCSLTGKANPSLARPGGGFKGGGSRVDPIVYTRRIAVQTAATLVAPNITGLEPAAVVELVSEYADLLMPVLDTGSKPAIAMTPKAEPATAPVEEDDSTMPF